jgi:hypothetical protein
VQANRARSTDTLLTVPLIGWTPRARASDCGFSVAKYGPQQSTDSWRPDCGNGVRPDGSMVTGNDPADTSLAIGPAFVTEWIGHLRARFGGADAGGVRYFNLDNEPELWNSTHRDVHPQPLGYDELLQRSIAYARAIKDAEPRALTLGPVGWGWTAYFYSAADMAAGGSWWTTRPDRRAHGDTPLVEWYLREMRAQGERDGRRLLDFLDLHYYPQAAGVSLQGAGGTSTQALRLRSTRSLWDPTYTDESWIDGTEGGPAVQLLPRMRAWVDAHYPGTKLAVTEQGRARPHQRRAAQADVSASSGAKGSTWRRCGPRPPASPEPSRSGCSATTTAPGTSSATSGARTHNRPDSSPRGRTDGRPHAHDRRDQQVDRAAHRAAADRRRPGHARGPRVPLQRGRPVAHRQARRRHPERRRHGHAARALDHAARDSPRRGGARDARGLWCRARWWERDARRARDPVGRMRQLIDDERGWHILADRPSRRHVCRHADVDGARVPAGLPQRRPRRRRRRH